MFQPANAIHIKSYFDDPEDTELYKLFPFMRFIREVIFLLINFFIPIKNNEFNDNKIEWRC